MTFGAREHVDTFYRVDRSSLNFNEAAPAIISEAITRLESIFDFEVYESSQVPSRDPEVQKELLETADFNLYSTESGPSKISLKESSYEVPPENRIRPREYYFGDP